MDPGFVFTGRSLEKHLVCPTRFSLDTYITYQNHIPCRNGRPFLCSGKDSLKQ